MILRMLHNEQEQTITGAMLTIFLKIFNHFNKDDISWWLTVIVALMTIGNMIYKWIKDRKND